MKEGETIHCIVFAGTWLDQFGLDCGKARNKTPLKKKKAERKRGSVK